MKKNFTLLTIALLGLVSQHATANKLYFSIDLKKNVGSTTWVYIQKGFEEAKNLKASTIIIEMNTYGGEVVYADSIRTKILNSEIPVYVFIDNNAASAGALISIACDKIYMRRGATIGAATVVNQTGEKMPDKYQSYMRATMRATAEAHGRDTVVNGTDTTFTWKRNPLIAEAMVDERTVVPNVSEAGKILTFTTDEAIKYGYCDGEAENIRQLIEKEMGKEPYRLVKYKPGFWDNVRGFLMSPILQSILIMLIIGGIYFEMQSPGIGFALGVAITAAVLYFAPLYIDGLAANWEILLFVIGVGLILVEIFVIPGFGVTGILGMLAMFGSIFLATPDPASAIQSLVIALIGSIVLVAVVLRFTPGRRVFKRLVLETSETRANGYVAAKPGLHHLIGKTGTAKTVLRPSGTAEIENQFIDVVTSGEYVEEGTRIQVMDVEGMRVIVREVKKE